MRNSNQAILCENISDFVTIIAALVQQGLTFKAYSDTLIIELTGGF